MNKQEDDHYSYRVPLAVERGLFVSFAILVVVAVWATLEYAVPTVMQFFANVTMS
ncbi:MAG: hypothetical protein V4611_00585 [Patescibacteria group bacterium]